MSRKTISVETLRVKVNEMLAKSTCSPDIRKGMMGLLEYALHETGNYNGFSYLHQTQVPDGQLPGINSIEDNVDHSYSERFANTDETRVHYS